MAGEREERGEIGNLVKREAEILEARVHRGVFDANLGPRTQDVMSAIRSGELGLGDAMRRGHHDVVGEYLGSTMLPWQAANAYRDLVSGVAGWY